MMMTIDSLRRCSIESPKLVDLSGNDILEGTNEAWMKNHPGQWVPQQERADLALTFRDTRRAVRVCKRCRQIQVEAGIDTSFPSRSSSSL